MVREAHAKINLPLEILEREVDLGVGLPNHYRISHFGSSPTIGRA